MINKLMGSVEMKKIIDSFIGIWCGLVSFVSPIWLTVLYLNISGLIYKYDYSMDDGTSLIIGAGLLILWILIGLVPNIYFGKKVCFLNKKFFTVYIICVVLLCLLCLCMCNWNIIDFLMA